MIRYYIRLNSGKLLKAGGGETTNIEEAFSQSDVMEAVYATTYTLDVKDIVDQEGRVYWRNPQ